jgi:alkylation response protein AidB-like acyl-CoA dehydrogenase
MNDAIDDERTLLVDTIARFCRDVLAPSAAEIDESGRSCTCHLRQLGKLGIMGLNLPEAYGGAGIPATLLFDATALIAGACGATASMVTAHWLATDAILKAGDEAMRARILPAAASGAMLGAFALSEPGAGSNPADMTTRAVRDGDCYRIRGTKHFISNAGEAAFVVVFAKTDAEAGARGISAFVVDAQQDGVRIGPPERTMGLRGSHVFEIAFDCSVPLANRLGAEGSGFRTALAVLDSGRVEIAACAVGIAEAALNAAIEWAKVRAVDGAPIGRFQGLRWMMADMATDIAAARALGMNAARRRERGERFSTQASMAKLFASEMVERVTDKALQIHGGYGYTRGLPLERYVRDCRIFRIYEGTSEIQRNIIARSLLGE